MSYQAMGRAALDYEPCYYDDSRIWFRGPKPNLDQPYVAFLGGTETFGKFLPHPYPMLAGMNLKSEVLNLGVVNAGVDMYLGDPVLVAMAQKAKVTVIQVMSAANLSNKYYAVHQRRNDRFVRASEHLRAHAPKLDLTNVHFTRHLMEAIYKHDQTLFELIRSEVRMVWRVRMEQLLAQIGGKIILVWFSRRGPDTARGQGRLEKDPLFVDTALVDTIRPMVEEIIYVRPSEAARREGVRGMVFHPPEAEAAAQMLGVQCHQEAAELIRQSLIPMTVV